MKVPKRKRKLPKNLTKDRKEAKKKAASIIREVSYTGSPDHKDTPSKLLRNRKAPSPRPDASICPKDIQDSSEVEKWLTEALKNGVVSEVWEGAFPKYVWYYHRKRKEFYIGRLVNRGNGEYKGFPVTEEECPKETRKLYESN